MSLTSEQELVAMALCDAVMACSLKEHPGVIFAADTISHKYSLTDGFDQQAFDNIVRTGEA